MSPAETNTRVVIIGCGYVGSALGAALARDGHDVVGTTTSEDRFAELRARGIKPVLLDIADVDKLRLLLADSDVAYLTIAAGRNEADYRAVYLLAATNMIAAAEGTPLRRIIYTSSTRVYAQTDGRWVDESSPTDPPDDNGRALVETERVLLEGAKATAGDAPTKATIVRLGGIHGASRDLHARIRSRAGTELTKADAFLNLIHLDDVVAALTRLLDVPHRGVLNLTDDQPETHRELYDRVLSETALEPIRWIAGTKPPNLGKRIRNDLIKKTLDLALQHPGH